MCIRPLVTIIALNSWIIHQISKFGLFLPLTVCIQWPVGLVSSAHMWRMINVRHER